MPEFLMNNHKSRTAEDARKEGISVMEIDQNAPGQGFADDLMDAPVDEETQKQMDDIENRIRDRKQSELGNELTQLMKEENTNNVRKYRFNHQEEFVNYVPSRILWMGDFLSMLQKIRPDAFYAETSYRGLRGLGFVQNGVPEYSGTAVMNGNMPEWSKLRIDARMLPTNEAFRGWRTVLLNCISKRYFTVEQCNEVFGAPIGERSRHWYRTLFIIRNERCPECLKQQCECMDGWDYLRADKHAYAVPDEIAKGRRQEAIPREECRIYVP